MKMFCKITLTSLCLLATFAMGSVSAGALEKAPNLFTLKSLTPTLSNCGAYSHCKSGVSCKSDFDCCGQMSVCNKGACDCSPE